MGGGGGSQQQAPQFNSQQTAQQQAQANVDTGVANAYLGNTNQITPYGTLTYQQIGSQDVGGHTVPQFQATTTLSPDQQQIYNNQTALQKQALGQIAPPLLNQVQKTVSTPLDFSNLPAMPGDQTQAKNDAYNALMSRQLGSIGLAQQQQATQLANQGIAPGSQAWDNAMKPFAYALNDATNQATINAGNIAGQNIQQAQTLRNQGIQEAQTLRNQPLQDYSTLLGFGGSVQNPSWAPATQASIPATDVTSPAIAAYQGQVNAYNQNLQQNNAMMGGLFGLGGSALMAGGMYL